MSLLAALSLPSPARAPGEKVPAPPGIQARGGTDVELLNRERKFPTRYGDLKVGVIVKALGSVGIGGGESSGGSGTATSKLKDGERLSGAKANAALRVLAEGELFSGLAVRNLSVGAEFEFSGDEVTVQALLRGDVVIAGHASPAQLKFVLLSVKDGVRRNGPGVEFKVAPVTTRIDRGALQAELRIELKLSFSVDPAKVAAEVGKRVLEEAIEREVKRELQVQGAKVLSRGAAGKVLARLGPLAAAFSVGLDIGMILNATSAAPQVAGQVLDDILGDLRDRYHAADTLGKMWLISKNSPRILAGLVAAGVVGAAAGIGDLLLFKLFGLDRLGDYAEALKLFGRGVQEVAKVARVPAEAIGGSILYGALALGIKTHPKHAVCAHGALEPVIAAVHARLRPHYRERGGINKVIGLTLASAQPPQDRLLAFARHLVSFKLGGDGRVDVATPEKAAASLRALPLPDFMRYLEANHLIRCDVKIGDSVDPDSIDDALIAELTG